MRENIRLTTSTCYNPTGNSIVERANKTIGNILRSSKGSSLKGAIRKCNRNLSLTYHSTLKASPYEILYQKHP